MDRRRRAGIKRHHAMPPRSWSRFEEEYLQEQWGKLTPQQIADVLGRTRCGVSARAQKLRLCSIPRWTEGEEEYLMGQWGMVPASQIAHRLGRTVSACETRAVILGVSRRHNWFREALKDEQAQDDVA